MHAVSIATRADLERIEARPYAEYMAYGSVLAALDEAARRHGERTALSFVADPEAPESTRRWTHREFVAAVRSTAQAFRALPASDEPRVAILLPAIPQAYFALWGAEAGRRRLPDQLPARTRSTSPS